MSLSRDNLQEYDLLPAGIVGALSAIITGAIIDTTGYEAGSVSIDYSGWNQTDSVEFTVNESDDGVTFTQAAVRHVLPQVNDILPDNGPDIGKIVLDASAPSAGTIKIGYTGDKKFFQVVATPVGGADGVADVSSAVMSHKHLTRKVVNPIV